jgi:hypothetical protein
VVAGQEPVRELRAPAVLAQVVVAVLEAEAEAEAVRPKHCRFA